MNTNLTSKSLTFCAVFKYSVLYNFLFVNIWATKTKEVYSILKALWTTSMVWVVVIIFTLLFEADP